MAVGEVVGNIIEHAFAADSGHRPVLQVVLTLGPESIEAVLSDNGLPTEPTSAP